MPMVQKVGIGHPNRCGGLVFSLHAVLRYKKKYHGFIEMSVGGTTFTIQQVLFINYFTYIVFFNSVKCQISVLSH